MWDYIYFACCLISINKVDQELARVSNISGVEEITNGCLCCTATGRMRDAITELVAKYSPERIIIETSGSAFPAPLALQIKDMEDEGLRLDSIVTVIDCENFRGYEDTSYTARLQAQYTSVILMNKHANLSEREYDDVLDHVLTLNPDTPIIKAFAANPDICVNPDIVFGLDVKQSQVLDRMASIHTLHSHHGQDEEVELLKVAIKGDLTPDHLAKILKSIPKDEFYRIKGYVKYNDGSTFILNYAFGRWQETPVEREVADSLQVTCMVAPSTSNMCRNVLLDRFKNLEIEIK